MDEEVVKKLFDAIAPKYESRSRRIYSCFEAWSCRGDAAPMAILELVDNLNTGGLEVASVLLWKVASVMGADNQT